MDKATLVIVMASLFAKNGMAQEREEPFLYGNMDHWVTRRITESTIIGGNEKTLYEIGPDHTLTGILTLDTRLGPHLTSWLR